MLLPRMLLEEVEVLETLQQSPHPNLVQYHGCVVKRDRAVLLASSGSKYSTLVVRDTPLQESCNVTEV
nr:hypothetical protein CFP56_31711 [Quercus suber]